MSARVEPRKSPMLTTEGPDDLVETARDFPRITRKAGVMQGKACIRGMRVTVGMILGDLSGGVTVDELLEGYPYLQREDIMEALAYGAWLASERGNRLDPVRETDADRGRPFSPAERLRRAKEISALSPRPQVTDSLELLREERDL